MFALEKWESLPEFMQHESVYEYYRCLEKKRFSIVLKRLFDLFVGLSLAVVLMPIMIILAVMIKLDSKGPVIFCQERVTTNGKRFKILKFRTMVANAESLGTKVTTRYDSRITRMGKFLRKARLDELPQVFNVITGDMSFVGTRPEVPKYVNEYTDEMKATLLMPAGITSVASIIFKDEEELMQEAINVDETYIDVVLPQKMQYNLYAIKKFNFWFDIKTMILTVLSVCIKNFKYEEEYINSVQK